jgi:hypothetical protein
MAVAFPLAAPASRLRQRVAKAARDVVSRGKRLSRVARARAGYAGGVLSAGAGVAIEFGVGWALILGGVTVSASYLLLYDVDEP